MDLEAATKLAWSMGLNFDKDFNLYRNGRRLGMLVKTEKDKYRLSFDGNALLEERNSTEQDSIESLVQSGVYISLNGEKHDLVYGTSDEIFIYTMSQLGINVVLKNPKLGLGVEQRYEVLCYYESHGNFLPKIVSEWKEFEHRMKLLHGEQYL